MNFDRRSMLRTSAIAVVGLGMPKFAAAVEGKQRKFTMALRCGSIGVDADQREAIELAIKNGFESVTPEPNYLGKISENERTEMAKSMHEKGLVWGAAGLPVEFRKDETTFQNDLKQLPALASAMQDAGVTRVGTYLMPCHDDLTYVENFRQHADRLRQCANILGDCGQRFGMEYVGPKTLWTSKRYPFLHSMAETKDLIAEIGLDNVGFILDSWHWYTAHETAEDIRTLTNQDIIACDLNDAPKGLAIDQQLDNRRELPMATGVIDLKTFLSELVTLGYDGPVRAEPFNQPLAAMNNADATATTADAMRAAFALIGG